MLAKALVCLALNSYHEAGGEPFHGQVAVAQVVLRRAQYHPAKVCRVVYRPNQFSWTRLRPAPRVSDPVAWERAKAAARVAMLWGVGAPLVDHSAGADH
jgi:spore germination cell wall hydrolase CwlJ-like protein